MTVERQTDKIDQTWGAGGGGLCGPQGRDSHNWIAWPLSPFSPSLLFSFYSLGLHSAAARYLDLPYVRMDTVFFSRTAAIRNRLSRENPRRWMNEWFVQCAYVTMVDNAWDWRKIRSTKSAVLFRCKDSLKNWYQNCICCAIHVLLIGSLIH